MVAVPIYVALVYWAALVASWTPIQDLPVATAEYAARGSYCDELPKRMKRR